MSLLEKNREPSARELNWFGLLVFVFLCLIGSLASWKARAVRPLLILGTIGFFIAAIYYALPPIRRTIFLAWMAAVYPIGWTISHFLLALTYYLVLTPIGLALRLVRDPMQRRFDTAAETYWVEHDPGGDPARYFRQF